ncbi:MAG: hypothetical protein HOP11_13665 [Saprospiraceae bacterium]|nr:hypothetical protein [Saprospiraceae bacterium]
MKNLFYLLFIAIAFIISCTKDNLTFEENLLGDWIVDDSYYETIGDSIITSFGGIYFITFEQEPNGSTYGFIGVNPLRWNYNSKDNKITITERALSNNPEIFEYDIDVYEENYQKWISKKVYKSGANEKEICARQTWILIRK